MKACLEPHSVPVGRLTLFFSSAACTSLRPIPRDASRLGSSCARTAYFCAPMTLTCATPVIMEMRCEIIVSAYSSTTESGSVGELSVSIRTGMSAGFTLRKVGGFGMPGGSRRSAAAMADCTSCAAASRERSSENCSVMLVFPRALVEVIESNPGMVVNCRSSGVATEAAMVSGLAPGRLAYTWRVGKSTLGKSLTGSVR